MTTTSTSTTGSVKVRPGGPRLFVALAVLLLALAAILIPIVRLVSTVDAQQLWAGIFIVLPSVGYVMFMVWLVGRMAFGFSIGARGISNAVRHSSLLRWEKIAALAWCRTRWWGRRNHQLVAVLHNGHRVIVWGAQNPRQHDRVVTGLLRADDVGLVPPHLSRTPELYESWLGVSRRLNAV